MDVLGVGSGVWQEGATSSDTSAFLPSWEGAPVHLTVVLAPDTWLASLRHQSWEWRGELLWCEESSSPYS